MIRLAGVALTVATAASALTLPAVKGLPAQVEADDGGGEWLTYVQDEYRIVFVDPESSRGWMLSCGTYAGPAAFGPGVHYSVFGRVSGGDGRDEGEWHPDRDTMISSHDLHSFGEWVYAMLHEAELPAPFADSDVWRAPLGNFPAVWREAEREEVCTTRSQAYRSVLAVRNGYSADAVGEDWGLGDDLETLIYRRRVYKGGVTPPDLVRLRLSCRNGVGMEAGSIDDVRHYERDRESVSTSLHLYEASGWGAGDERVAYALLHNEPVDGVAASELGSDGFAKLWPEFTARCPDAETAYETYARKRRSDLE